MDSKGWIKLDRKLLDHPLWEDKPFSKGQAWIDILFLAEWKARYVMVGGRRRKAKAGQCWTTLSTLADRWGWSKEKVRRFLQSLERDAIVSLFVTADGTRLTVEKWGKYQHAVSDSETADETATVFPTNNIKKEESDAPFGADDADGDGMTKEEWDEFLRVQDGGH